MGKKKQAAAAAEAEVGLFKGSSRPEDYAEFSNKLITCTIDMLNDPQCPHCKQVFKRVVFTRYGVPTEGWRSTGIPVKLSPCGHDIRPWEIGLTAITIIGAANL